MSKTTLTTPIAWKTMKVSEVFTFLPTGSHSREEMALSADQTSVFNIHYGDLHTKYSSYVDFEKNKVPTLKDSTGFRESMLLRDGDLVMVDASEDYIGIGTATEIKNLGAKKCIAGLHTFAFRDISKQIILGYSALIFKHPAVHRRMMQVSTYGKVFGISKSSIRNINVVIPPKDEQIRILTILKLWDQYFEKLNKKIEIKINIKKGLMQQFLTGKKRIPGFNKSWKKYKLNEFGEIKTSSVNKKSNATEKRALLVNYMDVYKRDMVTQGDSFQSVTAKKSQFISSNLIAGDILFTPSSETQNDIGHSAVVMEDLDGVLFSYHLLRFRPRGNILNKGFSAYAFKTYKFYIQLWRRSQGATRYILSKNALGSSEIYIPINLKEQSKIAELLTTIDREINSLKLKRRIINHQRKYLLNNLVTGKIRVPENLEAPAGDMQHA